MDNIRKEQLSRIYEKGTIKKILKDVPEQSVEDLYQDIFQKACYNMNQLKDLKKMEPWISEIARNERKNYYARTNRERENIKEYTDQLITQYDDYHDSPDVIYIMDNCVITKEELWNLVFKQGILEGSILYKYYVENFRYKEIAQLFNCNYNTIKSISRRTKEKIKLEIIVKFKQ